MSNLYAPQMIKSPNCRDSQAIKTKTLLRGSSSGISVSMRLGFSLKKLRQITTRSFKTNTLGHGSENELMAHFQSLMKLVRSMMTHHRLGGFIGTTFG
jgi:hypothetical protein